MPFTKEFGSTAGAWTTATLWKPIDLCDPTRFAWTVSTSGTDEYYVRTAAGGNPGFVAQPDNVYIAGSNATEGTVGSLTAGQWDYGDNDTLGYSTVYVRLSAAPQDPDDRDPLYVKFYQYPRATEHVRFTPNSASINSGTGLDQSGVALGDFIVEDGYTGTIGSAALGYLFIDPDYFEFNGRGQCYINIHSAAISPRILGTAGASAGERGLYLLGSAMSVVDIRGGSVGIAWNAGETATATTIRTEQGNPSVWLGSGLSLTNLHSMAGELKVRCATTAHLHYAGTCTTDGTGAHTATTIYGGTYINNSSGTITTFNHRGGLLDETRSGAARTISTYNFYQGASIRRNKEAVTHTTDTIQESMAISYSSL